MTDVIDGSADPVEAVLDRLRHIIRLARRAGTDGERQAAELAARRAGTDGERQAAELAARRAGTDGERQAAELAARRAGTDGERQAAELAARRAGTDGERQAAELAARRIADRHGIALESVEVGPDAGRTVKADEATAGAYRGCEFGMAAWIIREHFAVQVMFCVNRLGHGHLSWFGTRVNIDVARYAFDIIIRECRKHCRAARGKHERAWREYREKCIEAHLVPCPQKFSKESFMRGWFHVINEKLTAHPLRNDLDAFRAEKRRLEAAFDRYRQSNAVTDVRHRPRRSSAWSVAAGMEAAKSVNLSRPCEGRAPAARVGRTLMLEAR